MTLPLPEPAPEFLHELYRRAFGRLPDEYETSYFLHRLLIGGETREAVASQVLRSGDERFVAAAYRELQGRPPSPEELASGLATVQTGLLGRVVLLRELGRRMPEWDAILPEAPGLAEVLALDGEAFVRAAYRLAAGRQPSAAELLSASQRLGHGALTKAGLLLELSPGQAAGRQRWFKVPFIGRLLHIAALVWNLPELEREMARLRHRNADLEIRYRLPGGKSLI